MGLKVEERRLRGDALCSQFVLLHSVPQDLGSDLSDYKAGGNLDICEVPTTPHIHATWAGWFVEAPL